MSSLYEIDEHGTLAFNFHQGQLQAWDSERRFVFVLAGTQGGKTSFGPWWLWREIQRTADPKGGENDYLAVTSSYDLFKLKMLPALRDCFEQKMRSGRYWAGDRIIELCDPADGKFWARYADDKMWGRIILRSASAEGGLESSTGRAGWADECGQDDFPLESLEALRRRLSLARGRLLGTTTPYNLGWIKTEIHDRWRDGDPEIDVIQFPSTANPLFSTSEFEDARSRMPGWRFDMFYRGILAKPAGLIYDCFIDKPMAQGGHLVEPFAIPREWPRYAGLDFGAVNTAKLWIAEDTEKGRFFAYRESLEGGKSTREHVAAAVWDGRHENVIGWWGGAPSEDQQRMDWTAEGLTVNQPPVADVEGQIARVYGLFKRMRLFVFNDCRGLLDELGTYKRKLDDRNEPTEEIQDKRKFHRLDALRYVASGITGGQVTYGESLY